MKVSICMATYNGGEYIREQISSILNQKFDHPEEISMELIFSDDGSTDDTIRIINSFNDDRIKLFRHTVRKNNRYFTSAFACSTNFNFAISKATGDYIFISDQDDVWYDRKIEKTLAALGGNMM